MEERCKVTAEYKYILKVTKIEVNCYFFIPFHTDYVERFPLSNERIDDSSYKLCIFYNIVNTLNVKNYTTCEHLRDELGSSSFTRHSHTLFGCE